MPAIGAVARDAARRVDPRELLVEIEAEHDYVVDRATTLVAGASSVATISNSSLVERVMRQARPNRILVAVNDQLDEGHLLVSRLRDAGLDALASAVGAIEAELAVVGSDAIFVDGGFVNRSGTGELLEKFARRPVIVLGDRWRHVAGPTPETWSERDMFEPIKAVPNIRMVDGQDRSQKP